MKLKIRLLLLFIISLTSLFFLFTLVDPADKPLILLFVPVILLWLTLYSGIKLVLTIFINKTTKLHTVAVAVGVSFLVLLFLLSGIGQLTIRDIVLIAVLAAVTAFYFYRTWV